jgi:Tetratricopeptide repeat
VPSMQSGFGGNAYTGRWLRVGVANPSLARVHEPALRFAILASRAMRRVGFAASAIVLCLFVTAGCQTVQEFACGIQSDTVGCEVIAPPIVAQEGVPTTATIQEPTDVQYYPSDQPLRLGLEHFGRGNYGMAERYFRDAVEKAPRDVTAWVGLAASYDRLRRFDLADQAYAQALKLRGPTLQILNNQGYSYMLRGDFVRAREKFQHAYKLDPYSPTIQNNLQLLSSSQRFVTRPAE